MKTTKGFEMAKRVREVLLNGRWIANTNYKEQITSLNRAQALTKVGTLNSIAALTFHINYYLVGLNNVFNGGELSISDKYSFDLPEIRSEEDWQRLTNDLVSNAEQFAAHVEQMTDEQLNSGFVKEEYGTYERNIEAVIEHSYYHLGQISLIRKMIMEQ